MGPSRRGLGASFLVGTSRVRGVKLCACVRVYACTLNVHANVSLRTIERACKRARVRVYVCACACARVHVHMACARGMCRCVVRARLQPADLGRQLAGERVVAEAELRQLGVAAHTHSLDAHTYTPSCAHMHARGMRAWVGV